MHKKRGVSRRRFVRETDVDRLLRKSEISLWLNHYDDIFSDFDSRPYSERALSDDFLAETKRASRDKRQGGIELSLLVPKDKRSIKHEMMIKKRLHEHFKKHYHLLHNELREVFVRGTFFAILGVITMFIASYILFNDPHTLSMKFLITFLEPAGWFFFWEGLGLMIFKSKIRDPDFVFYRKMSSCNVGFTSYQA